MLGFIQSVKPTKKPHARHSGDHTQTHWWHRRRQKNGKEGTWKQTAEQAGYWMGLVAVALFILIGWACDAVSFDLASMASRPSPRHARIAQVPHEAERGGAQGQVRALQSRAAHGDEPRLDDDGRFRAEVRVEGVEGIGAPFPHPLPLPNIRSVHKD